MPFYEDKRDGVVKRLLTRYGTPMELLEQLGGTFNEETGGLTATTEKKHSVLGLIGKYTRARKSETTVATRNQYVYLSPAGMTITPASGQRLKVAGIEYTIFDVEIVAPAGVPVLYQLEVGHP